MPKLPTCDLILVNKAATIPEQYQCGLKGPRSRARRWTKIFGGEKAEPAEWPWMVRLWMAPEDSRGHWGMNY